MIESSTRKSAQKGKLSTLKDKHGNLLTDKKETKDRWKEQFEELVNFNADVLRDEIVEFILTLMQAEFKNAFVKTKIA